MKIVIMTFWTVQSKVLTEYFFINEEAGKGVVSGDWRGREGKESSKGG